MTARGAAHGAVSVLNGVATGIGCALAVEGGVEAEWAWTDASGLGWRTPGVDHRVAAAVLRHVRRTRGTDLGARASTRSAWPPARGLKTSSAAAAALLQAALRDLGEDPGPDRLAREAVHVARSAGVTLTGAYDDQLATVLGGCRLADTLARTDLGALPVPDVHVAVWVPDAPLPKERLRGLDPASVVPEARAAEALARHGRIAEAMTRNGAAWNRLYRLAGLPARDEPVQAALAAGAHGAGLSGTGPAVAALFDARGPLPAVPGGAWTWTRAAEGVHA